MGSCKCRRNVYMLAIAFLCNFTSYMTLESMQSSLNRSTGTTALSLLYTTLVLSSLVLPPLAIAKLNCRKSLFISILMYGIYTLANFYPKPYVLIPAAILLGTGASVMWTAAFYYVMQVAQKHAKEKGKEVEKVTGEFFGKFTSLSHFSIIIGTVFMSVIFESLKTTSVPEEQMDPELNANTSALGQAMTLFEAGNQTNAATTSSTKELMSTALATDSGADICCGLYYKLSHPEKKKNENEISELTMYVLLSCYLAFNIVAACLCLCLEEITGKETVADDVCVSMSSLNGDAQLRVKDDEKGDGLNGEALVKKNDRKEIKTIEDDKSVFKLLKSSLKLIYTDATVLLLVPFTLHYGMIQGFVRGTFNASWITCSLGIKYVAYVTCMYGGVMIIGCYAFGKLLRYMSHVKIFACTMSLEVVLFVITLLWQPSAEAGHEIWVYFLIPFGFGICHSSLSSQLGSIYSRFYVDNKKAGTALLSVWNPMGSAIAYGLSGSLYPFHLVIMVLSTCVVGTIMYFGAEKIRDKSIRKYKAWCGS